MFQTENINTIDSQKFKEAQKRKKFIDGVLHNFVLILDELREYDKIQIVESENYAVNKILKLAIMDDMYFGIFEKILE